MKNFIIILLLCITTVGYSQLFENKQSDGEIHSFLYLRVDGAMDFISHEGDYLNTWFVDEENSDRYDVYRHDRYEFTLEDLTQKGRENLYAIFSKEDELIGYLDILNKLPYTMLVYDLDLTPVFSYTYIKKLKDFDIQDIEKMKL